MTLPRNSDAFLADIASAFSIDAYLAVLMEFITHCWTLLHRSYLCEILFTFGIVCNNHLLMRLKSLASHVTRMNTIFIGIDVIVLIAVLANVHEGS